MKSFKDFKIEKTVQQNFTGNKIKISKILNKEVIVYAFKIEKSKFDGDCLHLQIGIGDTKYVVFTGAKKLMEMIQKVAPEDFPFKTTIIEENESFEFT